jgi:hypothetical protein
MREQQSVERRFYDRGAPIGEQDVMHFVQQPIGRWETASHLLQSTVHSLYIA